MDKLIRLAETFRRQANETSMPSYIALLIHAAEALEEEARLLAKTGQRPTRETQMQ